MRRLTEYALMATGAFALCLGTASCAQDDALDSGPASETPQNPYNEDDRPIGETIHYRYNIEYRIDGQTEFKAIHEDMLDACLSLDNPDAGKRVYRFRSTDGTPLSCVNVVLQTNDGQYRTIAWPESGEMQLADNLRLTVVSASEFAVTLDMNSESYTGMASLEIDRLPFEVFDSWKGITIPFALPENVPSIQPYHPLAILHY